MSTIATPGDWPLSNGKWVLRIPEQKNRSGWTGTSKTIGLPGAEIWAFSGDFAPLVGDEALPWRGFFFSLRGTKNCFAVPAVEAAQTAATNPTVDSGAGDGNTVPLTGLPHSATVLKAGQMMTVSLPGGHRRLVVLEADLVSNGSGNATATFSPELRETPAPGAAVEIQEPFALMVKATADTGWNVDLALKYGFVLEAEEAL